MTVDQAFQAYATALRKHALKDKTEHTDRGALETLLQAVADDCSATTKVQHEPKRAQDKGAPDFKVTRQAAIIGYVEVKQIGANLDAVLKSEQIKKYLELNPNVLLTDYLRFIWISNGKIKESLDARLGEASTLEGKPTPLNPERVADVEKLLVGFFKTAPKGVKRASELADALAVRSRLLRDFLSDELERQEEGDEAGKLLGLYKAFKEQVSHELTLKEFADAFAQTLAYGLFLAKLNVKAGQTITLSNAEELVPGGFSLIRELVGFLKELNQEPYRDIRWVVEEILSIVNWMNVDAVREDLSFKKRKAMSRGVRARSEEEWRLFSKDPFVYFYEDYLAKYDKAMKKARGVYYTPPPIVNFIVRAINDILKDTFEIEQGLADRGVTVLDFACGTGTFLVEVLERIFDEIGGPEDARAPAYVREHILQNIYGFEYLIAPYTIAHLKLSQYLTELAATAKNPSIALKKDERFQVFLTNTLEPIEPQRNYLLPELTHETEAAQEVKNKKILVITGNPPYAGHSKNASERIVQELVTERRTKSGVAKLKEPKLVRKKVKTVIGALIEDYKLVDGRPLGEQNSKWLQDDYVKFIRFAQDKMDQADEGIVGIITNHSYLDNPTFRGMRQSLTQTFDQIWILDLHGSTKPKELTPEGVENDNVFDIQKGVAVVLMVKKPGAKKGVWFSEFWGTQLEKYQAAAAGEMRRLEWEKVKFFSPYYMFRPLDWTGWDRYQTGWPLADSLNEAKDKRQVFDISVLGFQSHRDHFAVSADREEMARRVSDMVSDHLSDAEIAAKYEIKDNRDWSIRDARHALRATDLSSSIMRCAYRPFDSPFCFFGSEFMDYPRRELLEHVAGKANIELLASRQIGTAEWRHAFVATEPANDCLISDQSSEANQVFPLWRFDLGAEPKENLSSAFRGFLDDRYDYHYSPEEILGYAYAVLNAPTYRARYAEFLRIDFPRIPFPESRDDFDTLSALGWTLVEAHLLRKVKRRGLAKYLGQKQGEGEHRVDAVRYDAGEAAIYINDSQRFAPIPPELWNFHIGGYQVLDKYLKSRRTHPLSLDEIEHVAKVADVLAFTIEQMAAIDVAYKAAFPQPA